MDELAPVPMGVGQQAGPVISDFKKGIRIVERFIKFIDYSGIDNLDEKKLTYENIMKAIDLFK